jgi:bisphosphoglycerate-independent phosphoglycerate mutase (AlkP superfamily)
VSWNGIDPKRGYPAVSTVLAIARRAGLKTAMFVGKRKLASLASPGSVNYYEFSGFTARKVFEAALPYLVKEQPDVTLIHVPDPDSAGHESGWMGPEYLQAVRAVDVHLGRLVTGLERTPFGGRLLVIVSADHGGHAKTHGTAAAEDMTIPWIAWGAGIRQRTRLVEPVSTMDTAATVLAVLGLERPQNLVGQPVWSALEWAAAPVAAVPSPAVVTPASVTTPAAAVPPARQ